MQLSIYTKLCILRHCISMFNSILVIVALFILEATPKKHYSLNKNMLIQFELCTM